MRYLTLSRNVPTDLSLIRLAIAVLIALLSWCGTAQTAWAQSARQKDADTQDAEKPKKKSEEQRFRWDDHPSLLFGEGTRVDFRFRLQTDVRGSEALLPGDDDDGDDEEDTAVLDVARRRLGIEGEILNMVDYQIERELGVEREPWRDVYLNYKQFDFAEVRVGKFKLPFGLDENTSSTNRDFVYRSRIGDLLSPGRDRGIMVHGRVLDRDVLEYEFGAFAHDGRNARTNNPDRVHGGRTVAGRANVQPFRSTKSLLSDLAIGVAFTTSTVPEGFPGVRGRTALDLPFYQPDLWVNGQRRRIGLQARWRPGPFSIKSEYIRLTDERLGQGVDDGDLSPFLAAGWYVSGTWAVTGEQKADGLVRPARPFLQGGFGAIELSARIEGVRFGSIANDGTPSSGPRADVVLGNSDRIGTFGFNWYLNRWIKIQANIIREAIREPAEGQVPSAPTFWSRVLRFQLSI
jgi:phosphate-selective porin OprO and OprP